MKLQDYMDKKPVLETGQLILRPLQVSDVADLKEWMGAPSLYQYWGKRPGKGDLNPELLFQKKEKPTKSLHWGIVHKKDDKVVGEMWVYLIEKDRMAKVAFRLSPAYQGKWWSSVLRKRNCKGSGRMSTFRILRHIKHWKRPDSGGRAISMRGKWLIPGVITIYTA